MKIKNKRGFAAAMATMILIIVCLIVYMNNSEVKFGVSSILLFVWSVINFIRAFSKKSSIEELAENADERDLYIVTKTSHLTIRIMIYVLSCSIFISAALYIVYNSQSYIIIACTLCTVLTVMFMTFLCSNIYFEKHE